VSVRTWSPSIPFFIMHNGIGLGKIVLPLESA
jgi:hypothetical protein